MLIDLHYDCRALFWVFNSKNVMLYSQNYQFSTVSRMLLLSVDGIYHLVDINRHKYWTLIGPPLRNTESYYLVISCFTAGAAMFTFQTA